MAIRSLATRARTTPDPPIVEFKARHQEALRDPDLIDLSQAVPAYPPPPPVSEALVALAWKKAAHLYTPDSGLPECREAIAGFLRRRHGARVIDEQILITPGANAAFHFVANVLLDPGEPAALLTPYYFNHAMSINLLGSRVVELPWRDGIPYGEIEASGAKVLVLVTPNNPTGRALTRSEVEAALLWARRREAVLIFDETYLEFFPDNQECCSALCFPEWEETAIVLGSFSKSLAVTGHRVGYLCADPQILRQVLKVQDSAVICAPRLGQDVVIAALRWSGLDSWLGIRRAEIAERVRAFSVAFRDDGREPAPFALESTGAFFAWLGHPPTEQSPADRLVREAGVLVLPGNDAGRSGANHIRVAVGNANPPRLIEAARRMREILL